LAVIHKARDNSIKLILSEPELFAEFLRCFTSLEIFKDVAPSDIEDVPERLISLVSEQKDGDTIKRINLKGGTPLFVITIVEHESKVNFRSPFKMLLYIALILDAYEKEVNKEVAAKDSDSSAKISLAKDFKYPPILPIVFYDGESEWTAETNFLFRTEMHEIFEKYIPKFEYELVSLRDYSFADLATFGNVLSLFMMIDKLRTAEDFSELGKLPKDYVEQLRIMNVPTHLKELLVKVATVLLKKINVPQDHINTFVDKIDERGVSEMILLENYDWQETRRQARAEAEAEIGRQRAEANRQRAEFDRQRAEADRQRAKAEARLKFAVNSLLDRGTSITDISTITGISENDIQEMLNESA